MVLRATISSASLDARRVWDDADVRRELAVVAAELDALWALTKRNVSQRGPDGVPGVGGSVFKLAYYDTRERLGRPRHAGARTGRAGARRPARPSDADHVEERLYALSLSIAAGTSQIQRNIVGERILGLPKER